MAEAPTNAGLGGEVEARPAPKKGRTTREEWGERGGRALLRPLPASKDIQAGGSGLSVRLCKHLAKMLDGTVQHLTQ